MTARIAFEVVLRVVKGVERVCHPIQVTVEEVGIGVRGDGD